MDDTDKKNRCGNFSNLFNGNNNMLILIAVIVIFVIFSSNCNSRDNCLT